MRNVLGLVLLVVACSSGATGAGEGDDAEAGSGGASSAASAASSGAKAGKQGAAGPDAASGTAQAGGTPTNAAGSAATDDGGESSSSGAPAGAGAGGASTGAGAQAGEGGAAPQPDPTSGAGAGGAPADTGPDPCEGKTAWDPQESWTQYEQNEQRSFGGVLWRCQSPQFCGTYPGSPNAAGWLKVEDCAGGPTGEEAPCQCDSGACCDGCYFRPRSYFCGEVSRYQRCTESGSLEHDYWNLFCNGDAGGACERWAVHTKYAGGPCGAGSSCVESSADAAACVTD